MAVTAQQSISPPYTGDGTTATFVVPFYFASSSHLVVEVDNVVQSSGTYTVSGAGVESGGSITFVSGYIPTSGKIIVIRRSVPLSRADNYEPNGPLPENVHELDHDNPWRAIQDIAYLISQSVKAPYSERINMTLPPVLTRASKLLGFDASGLPIAFENLVGSASSVIATGQTISRSLSDWMAHVLLSQQAPQKVQFGGVTVQQADCIACSVDGSSTSPRTDLAYTKPMVYLERHANTPATVQTCDWSNEYQNAVQVIETLVGAQDSSTPTGLAIRTFANTAKPGGSLPTNSATLHGAAILAQSNAPAGQANRDTFALNLIAASSSGNAPTNLVGVEVDVIPSVGAVLRPNQAGAFNATAFWAQSAGGNTPSACAYFASSTQTTPNAGGWVVGICLDATFQDYIAYFKNTVNGSNGKGVRIETAYQDPTGRVVEVFCNGTEYLRIDGGNVNPLWIRVGSALRNIEVGIPDSGGTGYRLLRVLN